MKTVRVVAAVIRSEYKIFATARGYGEFKGQWEFPGGKIESGEAMMVIRTSPFIAHRSSWFRPAVRRYFPSRNR